MHGRHKESIERIIPNVLEWAVTGLILNMYYITKPEDPIAFLTEEGVDPELHEHIISSMEKLNESSS